MLRRFRSWQWWGMLPLIAVLWGVILVPLPHVAAQSSAPAVSITVVPGFDSYFREDNWIPLRIDVSNNGNDIVGKLVVRPETSGSAIPNTFSAPISLPNRSSKTAFLYIKARSFASNIRVELLDDENVVYATQDTILRPIISTSPLYLVVSDSPSGTADLSSVTFSDSPSYQANWRVENIPDHSPALDAIDVMLFHDVDSGTLTSTQLTALTDWIAAGGHLIVAGGANWQATAAGLMDLLPLKPADSTNVINLDALSAFAGQADQLRGQTAVTTGALSTDAQVLAHTANDLPLAVRREFGGGTIDYLSVSPVVEPLRGWEGMTGLWRDLLTSVNPGVSWAQGAQDINPAIDAIEVLPGVNLLPEVLALLGFLALYIGLVGPVNYLVLNRINRRDWAWVTIPILITIFSVVAWQFGFKLRGNEAMLSRLTVVQSWPVTERARVDQYIGVFSPQRSVYTLAMDDNRMMSPISRPFAGGLLGGGGQQTNIDIRQTETFSANSFPVDASFVASFASNGIMDKPAISGTATLSFELDGMFRHVQGAVRNDTDIVLGDPVLLMRGKAVPLGDVFEPGDIRTFSETLEGETNHEPAALEPRISNYNMSLFGRVSRVDTAISARDIFQNTEMFRGLARNSPRVTGEDNQEMQRRFAFLQSFMIDQFNSTARGERVFLAGWTRSDPLPVTLDGANWTAKDTTLYLIELDTSFEPPSTQVTLMPDQFTWSTEKRVGIPNYSGPSDLILGPGEEVVLRFTPLPDLQLKEVDGLIVSVTVGLSFGGANKPVALWNWPEQTWEAIQIPEREALIRDPARFIGPQNAVLVRLAVEDMTRINYGSLIISQIGRF